MGGLNADMVKPGLKALYYSGAHRLLAPVSRGMGLIFMLHQVSPEPVPPFAPNRGLTVTPEYLDAVLRDVADAGLEFVSLDEAHERIVTGTGKRFACFTLDDGYRDNLVHAYPVFKRHRAPFTVYIPSSFPGGEGELWWFALERIIASSSAIEFPELGSTAPLQTNTNAAKHDAFRRIYDYLWNVGQDTQRKLVSRLCRDNGIDFTGLCRNLIMSWDEVRKLAADPLVTIGAHTVGHYALAKLPEERARKEMKQSADDLADKLGRRPGHFSYPYGGPDSAGPREFRIARELGFKTAVTTRKGVLFPDHADYLTALPRVSLNGEYQSRLYTQVYLSGAPFALWNRFRRIDAA